MIEQDISKAEERLLTHLDRAKNATIDWISRASPKKEQP
jgi:hypothetical protein